MEYDIVIVGGGPAGVVAGVTARKYYPEKKILLIKSVSKGVVPCGIPYMYNTLSDPTDNVLGDKPLEANNIDLKIAEVKYIDKEKKELLFEGSEEVVSYNKLILATGSRPILPRIDGINKLGVYSIKKELEHLKNLKSDILQAKDVVIIGGGFIGVEFADELSAFKDKNITVVEFLPKILANSFDEEFSEKISEKLTQNGVKILTGKKVVEFLGGERVTSVRLVDGSEIPCQVVVMGIGARPNSSLAEDSGLSVGASGAIEVDDYMRTSDENIFAIGDCAEKRDFFTRKKIPVMLASTACSEARIAATSLFGVKVVRENKGTIATYSTKIADLTLGAAGLTEKLSVKEGFEIVIGEAKVPDKHPAKMPDTSEVHLKLVFSKQSGLLLGGQVIGGDSVGELINIISLALQKNTLLSELETLQVATHPKLTAAPTKYPLVIAAQDAMIKMMK